jgi:hypothetical protein
MKLIFKKVRETKNHAVYQLNDNVKSTAYFDKGLPETMTFELVANEEA